MSPIQLLSTDFDGTLIETSSTEPAFILLGKEKCNEVLGFELNSLVEQGGQWVINTGRPLDLILKGLEHFNAPVKPHYLITNERHIYHYHENGDVEAWSEWNQRCDEEHDLLFKKAGIFFECVQQLIAEYGEQATFLESKNGIPEELLVRDEALLDELSARILELPGRPEEFVFQRSHIHLHFCHHAYNKGSALKELSRFLSIPAQRILAVGDYHNDITMLTGEVATMVACPSNAHDLVKKTVKQVGGHVSLYRSSQGTAEAMSVFSKKLSS